MGPQPRRSGKMSATAEMTEAVKFPWCELPLIVQELIFKQLASDYDEVGAQHAERIAVYATVCSDWQAFFEKIIFRKLVLHPWDLAGFHMIVKRRTQAAKCKTMDGPRTRRQLAADALARKVSPMPRIQHIWLRVRLTSYVFPASLRRQSPSETLRNNGNFTKAVWNLLHTLSTWETLDPTHGQQLTLELSAHSPSDSQCLLEDDPEHRDEYPYRAGISAQREYIVRHPRAESNEFTGMFGSQPVTFITFPTPFGPTVYEYSPGLVKRLISDFGFDISRRSQTRLPEVRMVSEFVIRRQYHRSISDKSLLRLLRESLTGLRKLRFERWRTADPMVRQRTDLIYAYTLTAAMERRSISGASVPQPLETVSLFEDFSERMHGFSGERVPRQTHIKRFPFVASSAVNIKNLAISFISDAKDTLNFSNYTFPNLESIALTSQHWLEPSQENINKLLLLAAKAAEKMPKLQIMEIWTCGDGQAAILRYEATGTPYSSACKLTWRCSWVQDDEKPISWGKVAAAWGHVASTIAGRELTVVVDPLPRVQNGYQTYHAIIHKLKLRNFILDPTSVMQARVVAGDESEPEVEEWRRSEPDSYWSRS